MITNKATEKLGLGLMLAGLLVLAACRPDEPATEPAGTAVIQGSIIFGPLSPVEQEGLPTPETPPELYEGRMVLVFGPDGETLFTETPVQTDGSYRVELAPGHYVIGFTLLGIESSKGLPVEVSLTAGQVFDLDIHVDTGIR